MSQVDSKETQTLAEKETDQYTFKQRENNQSVKGDVHGLTDMDVLQVGTSTGLTNHFIYCILYIKICLLYLPYTHYIPIFGQSIT